MRHHGARPAQLREKTLDLAPLFRLPSPMPAEGKQNEPNEPPEPFELKERFVWKWHPHAWLTAFLILLVYLLIHFLGR